MAFPFKTVPLTCWFSGKFFVDTYPKWRLHKLQQEKVWIQLQQALGKIPDFPVPVGMVSFQESHVWEVFRIWKLPSLPSSREISKSCPGFWMFSNNLKTSVFLTPRPTCQGFFLGLKVFICWFFWCNMCCGQGFCFQTVMDIRPHHLTANPPQQFHCQVHPNEAAKRDQLVRLVGQQGLGGIFQQGDFFEKGKGYILFKPQEICLRTKFGPGIVRKDSSGKKLLRFWRFFWAGLEVLGGTRNHNKERCVFFHVSRPLQHTFAWFNREQKKR